MTLADLFSDPLRVVHDSDTVFEIENRPVRRAAITSGGILLAVAMGLAAIADGAIGTGTLVLAVTALIGWMILGETVQMTQLRLDRSAGEARVRVTGLRRREARSVPLSKLERAEPRTRYGKNSSREKVELYLVGPDGDTTGETLIPMGRADPEDIVRMAGLINAWLNRTDRKGQP